jgi:hypothetical protein
MLSNRRRRELYHRAMFAAALAPPRPARQWIWLPLPIDGLKPIVIGGE